MSFKFNPFTGKLDIDNQRSELWLNTRYLKLDASNDPITGPLLLKNDVNSTTAFQIQQSDSTPVFNVDTTNSITSFTGAVTITNTTASVVPLTVKDAPGQTAAAFKYSQSDDVLMVEIKRGGAGVGQISLYTGGAGETKLTGNNALIIGTTATAKFRLLPFGNDIYFQNTISSGDIYFTGNGGADLTGDFLFKGTGKAGFGTTSPLAKLHIKGTSDEIQTIIQANATQTANLTEWQNSSGTVLTNISATAGLDLTGANAIRITSSLDSDPLIKLNDLTIVENTLTYNSGFQATSTGQSTTFTLIRTSSSHALMQGGIDGDTFRRIVITADGSIDIGSGSSSRDTNLYRFGANMLMTDDAFNAGRYLSVGSTDELARFHVVGRLDEIQQIIQANATQTANLQEWQNSSGTVLSGADERGILFSHGGTNVTNVFMGDNAGNTNTSGGGNFALGSNSLALNTNGISNIAIGSQALGSFNNGDENVVIGRQAGFIRSGGSWNVFIGSSAGRSGSSNSNVGIGTSSLYTANSGTNVAIGTNSGKAVTGGGNVLIGNGIGKTLLTAIDNQLHIHNADTTTPLIYGEFDTPLLKIHGRFQTNEDRIKSTETSTGTATMSDDVEIHFCNSASDYVLTLPTQTLGKQIRIINKNTGVITLTPASGTIGGETTQLLTADEVFVATSDSTNWW